MPAIHRKRASPTIAPSSVWPDGQPPSHQGGRLEKESAPVCHLYSEKRRRNPLKEEQSYPLSLAHTMVKNKGVGIMAYDDSRLPAEAAHHILLEGR